MQGRNVCIVGAGNSAGQAAVHLAKHAATVTMLVRGRLALEEHVRLPRHRARRDCPTSSSASGAELVDGEGDEQLEAIVVRDRRKGTTERIPTSGLFVMIGAEPRTDWLEGAVASGTRTGSSSPAGTEVAGDSWPLERAPMLLETSLPGVFAAGDVRHGSVKRVTTAMGEGATAIQLVHEYLAAEDERRATMPSRS